MEDVKGKCCPFLVRRIEHPPVLKGHGTIVVDEFLPCHGKDCAAYYRGGCLRLVPPALVIGEDLTDKDLEKLREELKNAPIMLGPVEPEEPQPRCSNCGNYETKDGCADCVLNAENRSRKETMALNWVPKEVPL